MGKIDILTKDYISDNNIFADAFNYFIYDGENVVDPTHLIDLDTASLAIPYGANGEVLSVQKYRDKMKSWTLKKDDSAAYLLLAVENQTELHQAMPCEIWFMMPFSMRSRLKRRRKNIGWRKKKHRPKQSILADFMQRII